VRNLIGLCGFAQAGKDTVGKLLIDEHRFDRVAFADAVRELLLATNPIVLFPETLGPAPLSYAVSSLGWEGAKQLDEVRGLLQRLGGGARGVLHEDVWIDAAFETANELLSPTGWGTEVPAKGVVFTDCRYENEAVRISDEGGVLVYISRNGFDRVNVHDSEDMADEMEDAFHFAERTGSWHDPELPFDIAIDNSGDLADLACEVEGMMYTLGIYQAAKAQAGESPARGRASNRLCRCQDCRYPSAE